MGVTAAVVVASAVAAYTIDSTEKQKKLANDQRNEQKAAAAEAEAKLKEQQVQNDVSTTQKRRRVNAMSASSQDAGTGRAGTILGSGSLGTTPAPSAAQTKTLLGQ